MFADYVCEFCGQDMAYCRCYDLYVDDDPMTIPGELDD